MRRQVQKGGKLLTQEPGCQKADWNFPVLQAPARTAADGTKEPVGPLRFPRRSSGPVQVTYSSWVFPREVTTKQVTKSE